MAFMGPNGAGKSTLADLILGILTPDAGTISVDGVPLAAANREHWQRNVAYVPQSVYLLDASLADNIAFGVEPIDVDPERLRAAARGARLEELIASLPNGYQEKLGDHGARVSGGQRQRIGIARALYRDAALLVFDEATSSLDGAAEEEVIATLAMLRGQHTVILIAHRPSSVRHCDEIFELQDGTVRARELGAARRLTGIAT